MGQILGNLTIDYCGNMIYEGGTLKQIQVDGGYVTFSGTTPVYHYYLKDHQGNNRVVVNKTGTVEEVNHYYPFGLLFGESINPDTQRFKYNGKELDMMHGLHMYDYGARQYDPLLCRFTTMDPMCEKYYHLSPYAYCGNNPVNAIDPDGMDWYQDRDGTYQFNPDVHSQDDLGKGQNYLWKEKKYNKIGVYYRSDGSILYNNETDAYKRIWNQADKHYRTKDMPRGKEVGAFILDDSRVLVLPDYNNDFNSSFISKYGYKMSKSGNVSHDDESFRVVAQIHTHQKGAGDPSPSEEDAIVSEILGTRPVFIIGHDEKIYGVLANNNSKSIFILPSPLNSISNLLNGGNVKLSKYVISNKWALK